MRSELETDVNGDRSWPPKAQRPLDRRLPAERGTPAQRYATVLGMLAVLFALRVAGQAIQHWVPLSFLPAFHSFQGSNLPYAILLPVQLAILAVMLGVVWRVYAGTLEQRRRASRTLTIAGGIYVATMLTRLAVGLTVPNAPAWFRSEISTVFHFVLAIFVLVLAAYHRRAPQRSAEGARS